MQLPPSRIDALKKLCISHKFWLKDVAKVMPWVTYDLSTAKIARRIHFEEAPIFDNLFIFLGSFHTEVSFFFVTRKNDRVIRWTICTL